MNRRRRLRGLACWGLCALLLGGCSSAPIRLHSLRVLPATHGTVSYAGPPLRVDGVALPAETDRLEITTLTAAGTLEIHESDHWAAPLSTLARQTLAADLIARLPPGKVVPAPLDRGDGVLGVSVVILRSGDDARGPRFVASWRIGTGRHPGGGDSVTLQLEPAVTAAGVADRFGELLAQLADRIAAEVGGQ